VPAPDNPTEAFDIAAAGAIDLSGDLGAAGIGPSEEEIRTRAYHRYLERGGGHGQDFDDWLEAERELRKARM
jgi:hypothetical protein